MPHERHEFDLQLLKEIVDSVCNYFNSPEVMRQIEVGVLQTLPSAIIISMVTTIWSKMKKLRNKKNAILDEENSWMRIERNIRKIDKEFSNHDYILSDGMLRRTYLKEHRPAMYSLYMLEDRLVEHLNLVDDEAQERMNILVRQMLEKQGITEEMKVRDQMEWVRAVNNIRNVAEEIVLKELIYR